METTWNRFGNLADIIQSKAIGQENPVGPFLDLSKISTMFVVEYEILYFSINRKSRTLYTGSDPSSPGLYHLPPYVSTMFSTLSRLQPCSAEHSYY